MELKTSGMEFASEMVIKATLKGLRIAEVPITLHRDGRSRPPHLKPWRDGWRHLRFMLIYSPRWLFLVPGLLLAAGGFTVGTLLTLQPFKVGGVAFDAGTLAVACMSVIIGVQLVSLAFFTKVFAVGEGLLPQDPQFSKVFQYFTLEKGIPLRPGVVTPWRLGVEASQLRNHPLWGEYAAFAARGHSDRGGNPGNLLQLLHERARPANRHPQTTGHLRPPIKGGRSFLSWGCFQHGRSKPKGAAVQPKLLYFGERRGRILIDQAEEAVATERRTKADGFE
jgi:hypothetical protein